MEDLSKLTAYVKKAAEDPDFLKSEQDYFFKRYHERYTRDFYIQRHVEIYDRYA